MPSMADIKRTHPYVEYVIIITIIAWCTFTYTVLFNNVTQTLDVFKTRQRILLAPVWFYCQLIVLLFVEGFLYLLIKRYLSKAGKMEHTLMSGTAWRCVATRRKKLIICGLIATVLLRIMSCLTAPIPSYPSFAIAKCFSLLYYIALILTCISTIGVKHAQCAWATAFSVEIVLQVLLKVTTKLDIWCLPSHLILSDIITYTVLDNSWIYIDWVTLSYSAIFYTLALAIMSIISVVRNREMKRKSD